MAETERGGWRPDPQATVSMQPHYSILKLKGMAELRQLFPEGEADSMNFALFSTSGVHGSYATIEEVSKSLRPGKEATLTVVVVQPRIVCMRYGDISVTSADIPYLRKLRETSWAATLTIGKN